MSPPAQGLMLALRSASADLALTSSPPGCCYPASELLDGPSDSLSCSLVTAQGGSPRPADICIPALKNRILHAADSQSPIIT